VLNGFVNHCSPHGDSERRCHTLQHRSGHKERGACRLFSGATFAGASRVAASPPEGSTILCSCPILESGTKHPSRCGHLSRLISGTLRMHLLDFNPLRLPISPSGRCPYRSRCACLVEADSASTTREQARQRCPSAVTIRARHSAAIVRHRRHSLLCADRGHS
jgi:hypothetical protein